MKITRRQLRRIIRESILSEQVPVPDVGGAPPAGPQAPTTKKKRWKAEVTSDYDQGYAAGMADEDPSEDASTSWDDGYTDALADIAEEEELAAMPPVAEADY